MRNRSAGFFTSFGLPLTAKGNFSVNQFLEAGEKIYVIGDASGYVNPQTQRMLPWNVPVAEHEARAISQNIAHEINGLKKYLSGHGRNILMLLPSEKNTLLPI